MKSRNYIYTGALMYSYQQSSCIEDICDYLVHISNFVTSVLYNICYERSTKSQFAALVDETSIYHW